MFGGWQIRLVKAGGGKSGNVDKATLAAGATEAFVKWIKLWRALSEKGRNSRNALIALYKDPENGKLKLDAQVIVEKEFESDDPLTHEFVVGLTPRPEADITVPLLVGVPVSLAFLTLGLWYLLPKVKPVTMGYVCNNVFSFVEAGLAVMFVVCLGFAVYLYFRVRNRDTGLTFHGLAEAHKLWSQVWFNIALAIFLGGIIYAIFHVGENICERHWNTAVACADDSEKINAPLQAGDAGRSMPGGGAEGTIEPKPEGHEGHPAQEEGQAGNGESSKDGPRGTAHGEGEKDPWVGALKSIIPNIFIYSLFFVIWQWAAKHYRVHWHNYVSNAFRHRALLKIEDLEKMQKPFNEKDKEDETVSDLRIMAAMLLLLPMSSAYAERDEEGGETGAERIVKVEEMLREVVTRRSRSRSKSK